MVIDLNKFEILIKERIKQILSRSTDLTVDSDGDEGDEVQSNFILHMAYEYNDRNNIILNKLYVALGKIKDKSFGLCEECDEYISEKRLEIFPEVRLCVRCAELEEKENKSTKGII